MLEIPEAVALSQQLAGRLAGKRVDRIIAGSSPHKFTWYYGDPGSYTELASGKTFRGAKAVGGMVEAAAGDVRFLFTEGANLRYAPAGGKLPRKHQFLCVFTDGSALVASVRMYGGAGAYREGENNYKYFLISKEKPSPLEKEFNKTYFKRLLSADGIEKLSAKQFLATEQRIPGLGNGVLQDILFDAGIHPKRKLGACGKEERDGIFRSVKQVLKKMTEGGGRDTELDLDGNPGGYVTIMSRNTVGKPCPSCGQAIEKASYMGGAVYFCGKCQPL